MACVHHFTAKSKLQKWKHPSYTPSVGFRIGQVNVSLLQPNPKAELHEQDVGCSVLNSQPQGATSQFSSECQQNFHFLIITAHRARTAGTSLRNKGSKP